MDDKNWILTYYQHINDGTITAGKWIHLVYEYIVKGLEDRIFYFDQKKANKVIRFLENFMHHSKGSLAPRLVKLEEWQKAAVSCMFGIVDDTGSRQFREVLLLIGRKCGKSLLASGIAEYMAYADGEYGADIYFLAPKLDQTEIVYNAFRESVRMEQDLELLIKPRKTDVYIQGTNTSIKKIAFSQKKSDGFNPHLTVCDELAAWPGQAGINQYEVMTSAGGSRKQPMILSITTANYVNDGIYDDLIKRATAILLGNSNERRLLPLLYMIDDLTKWNDMSELQKSLPNLGVSVFVDFMLNEIAKAEISLANKREFLCKFCNIKQNQSQAWIPSQIIAACYGEEIRLEDFSGCYAVGGIDLSQTTDLTVCECLIEKNGLIYVFAQFFMPANKLEDATAKDGIPYEIYVKKGWLQLSGDNYVDYHDCQAWFDMLLDQYKIYPLEIGYDRYSSQYLVQEMSQIYRMDDVYQGTNLTPVIREVEGLFRDGKFRCGNNELLKIHMLNAAIKADIEQNKVKLVKIEPTKRIDGTAALLDAMCVRQKWWNEIGYRLKNEGK